MKDNLCFSEVVQALVLSILGGVVFGLLMLPAVMS